MSEKAETPQINIIINIERHRDYYNGNPHFQITLYIKGLIVSMCHGYSYEIIKENCVSIRKNNIRTGEFHIYNSDSFNTKVFDVGENLEF